MRRRKVHADVKSRGLTPAEPLKLSSWSEQEACGMRGGAVKCIDIRQNPDCEGGWLYGN